jgi:hypothetical protein
MNMGIQDAAFLKDALAKTQRGTQCEIRDGEIILTNNAVSGLQWLVDRSESLANDAVVEVPLGDDSRYNAKAQQEAKDIREIAAAARLVGSSAAANTSLRRAIAGQGIRAEFFGGSSNLGNTCMLGLQIKPGPDWMYSMTVPRPDAHRQIRSVSLS